MKYLQWIRIITLKMGEKEKHIYLGLLEVDSIKQKIKKEYLKRKANLLKQGQ